MKDGEKMRIRNWVIEKVTVDDLDFMEVKTASGHFCMMYRIDSFMYGLIDSLEKDTKESVAVMFGNAMAAATLVDAQFQHEILEAIERAVCRMEAPGIRDDEDAAILAEEREKYEMKKEVGKAPDGD